MKTKYTFALIAASAVILNLTPLQAARNDDARIVSAAKQSYVYRTYLNKDDIKIHSLDGVVTLNGEVPDQSHKGMAEDMVENLPGVKRVENQLMVKLANEHSDHSIAFKIKSALLYHRSVSGTKTTVSVKDGVVTLNGVVFSLAQKELTEEYAGDIEGVKEVRNEMTVSTTPPPRRMSEVIDDASITAQVKSALLTHRSTSVLKTKVTTRNGVVTLTGEARNPAEKDLVTKITTDIKGVKNVVNDMEVKS